MSDWIDRRRTFLGNSGSQCFQLTGAHPQPRPLLQLRSPLNQLVQVPLYGLQRLINSIDLPRSCVQSLLQVSDSLSGCGELTSNTSEGHEEVVPQSSRLHGFGVNRVSELNGLVDRVFAALVLRLSAAEDTCLGIEVSQQSAGFLHQLQARQVSGVLRLQQREAVQQSDRLPSSLTEAVALIVQPPALLDQAFGSAA
ncbi:hypothetical protein [Kineococcus sp. SYSU DK018]|uniref:hypothetical protein n=1 Tax=Kineococcus sp. SYSU DK018 TaxID=3383139 RepID=UPI003D7E3F8B